MLQKKDGYTLIELSITIVIIAFVIGLLSIFVIVCKGNFWYTEAGVLKELRIDHPGVIRVLKTKKNIFDESVITVKEGNETKDYCLDTSIMWNYKFVKCTK